MVRQEAEPGGGAHLDQGHGLRQFGQERQQHRTAGGLVRLGGPRQDRLPDGAPALHQGGAERSVRPGGAVEPGRSEHEVGLALRAGQSCHQVEHLRVLGDVPGPVLIDRGAAVRLDPGETTVDL
ncbi:hypothetical protein GCM10010977_05960 [Citricoccus zhacaiensis]|uniref:Uncharacterized protein n=1 Tax=Citricoccus zhacaiensis TaxID=489142 RepID=A0ABQ2LPM0_9MICC|nr:hypothetical protein GCM10010977_05960 [Citricoccus zhacaiensis]